MATQSEIKAFIDKISKIAIIECNKRSKKLLPSVCIAQAACESAWGTSSKMITANAIFGIKAGSNWKGKVYSTKTKECYNGVSYTTITDLFRAYDSLEAAVSDYYDLITGSSRYSGAINETDAIKAITAIKNGGYATDPKYITTIMSIIDKYGLAVHDACMVGGRVLKSGCRGEDVKELQTLLATLGYSCGVIDGIFGAKTLEAVRVFQADNNLKVDGIVGCATRQALKN